MPRTKQRVGSTTEPTFKELAGPHFMTARTLYNELVGFMATEHLYTVWDLLGSDTMDAIQDNKENWHLMEGFHALRRLCAKHRFHILCYTDERDYHTNTGKEFTTWAIASQCKADGTKPQGLFVHWEGEPQTMDIINVPKGYLAHFGD